MPGPGRFLLLSHIKGHSLLFAVEPQHVKTNNETERHEKNQISLGISSVCSESSLTAVTH